MYLFTLYVLAKHTDLMFIIYNFESNMQNVIFLYHRLTCPISGVQCITSDVMFQGRKCCWVCDVISRFPWGEQQRFWFCVI